MSTKSTTAPAATEATTINLGVALVTTPTPDITDEGMALLVATYRGLDVKEKGAARAACNKRMMAAVMASDMVGAQFAQRLLNTLTSAGTKAPVEINPTDVLIDAVAELELAAWMIRVGVAAPAGLELPDDFDTETVSFVTIDGTTSMSDLLGEDRAKSVSAGARAFATAKRTRTTDRADIGEAILSAFDGMDSGAFLTVSEIANKSGSGTGAIAARLFPTDKNGDPRNCTVDGVTPGKRDGDTGPKGAFKN